MKPNLNYPAYGFKPRPKTKIKAVSKPVLEAVENVPSNNVTPAFICGDAVTLPLFRNEELDIDDWLGSAIEWE